MHAHDDENAGGADHERPSRMLTKEQLAALTAHVDERFDQLVVIVQQDLTFIYALCDSITALEDRFAPPPP